MARPTSIDPRTGTSEATMLPSTAPPPPPMSNPSPTRSTAKLIPRPAITRNRRRPMRSPLTAAPVTLTMARAVTINTGSGEERWRKAAIGTARTAKNRVSVAQGRTARKAIGTNSPTGFGPRAATRATPYPRPVARSPATVPSISSVPIAP